MFEIMIMKGCINLSIYTYFILGIILGLALATYIYLYREEKIEKTIESNKRIYSTDKLDKALEIAVKKISYSIQEKKRELTEDEKNYIIFNCLNCEDILKEAKFQNEKR